MKKHSFIFILSAMVGLLGSCSGSGEDTPPAPPAPEKLPISWQVQPQEVVQSKALIDDDDALREACTPTGGQSIGVWGSYEIDEYGQTFTHVEFDGISLTYAKKDDGSNPHNDWNYPGENKYWEPGGRYTFRACYPQELMEEQMTEMNSGIIQGPLNTAVLQEDIMVATAYVNTLMANLAEPVPLDLIHVFSALKFKVKAADGYDPSAGERVTSCWLQNQSADADLFTTSGYLVFSGSQSAVTLQWYKYDATSEPMYLWENETGLPFTEEATLYGDNKNDGWVLVVPQEVKENTLHLCYTLKNAGDEVFSVPIPPVTYQNGKQYTYVLTISGASAEVTLTIADWNELDSSHDINM